MSGTMTRLAALAVTLGIWGCGAEETVSGPPAGPTAALATTAASYTVRDLGTLGGASSTAKAINQAGVIVGHSNVAGSTLPHAFIWDRGVMKDLGALAGGHSEATAINDNGVVVGWSTLASGAQRAVRWKNGIKKNLGTLGGRHSQATGINEFGVIVGWSETASGNRHAFIWKEGGVMTDLGTLGGPTSEARGISRGGIVVGGSTTASGERHAFRWQDGVFRDLGNMGRLYGNATAVNTKGQIIGVLGPTQDAVGEELEFANGFLYYQEVMSNLGVGSGRPATFPRAISPLGVVVGQGVDTGDEPRPETAWVWEAGASTILPTLTPGDIVNNIDNHAGAYGVNRAGTIVGFSRSKSGRSHAVLWRRL